VRTIKKLANEPLKRQMFNKMLVILTIECFFGFILQILEMLYFWSFDTENKFWRVAWLYDAFWQVLFLCLFMVIGVAWKPSRANNKFSYLQVSADPSNTFSLDPINSVVMERSNSSQDTNVFRI